jgi:hypothetical protein
MLTPGTGRDKDSIWAIAADTMPRAYLALHFTAGHVNTLPATDRGSAHIKNVRNGQSKAIRVWITASGLAGMIAQG